MSKLTIEQKKDFARTYNEAFVKFRQLQDLAKQYEIEVDILLNNHNLLNISAIKTLTFNWSE